MGNLGRNKEGPLPVRHTDVVGGMWHQGCEVWFGKHNFLRVLSVPGTAQIVRTRPVMTIE